MNPGVILGNLSSAHFLISPSSKVLFLDTSFQSIKTAPDIKLRLKYTTVMKWVQ